MKITSIHNKKIKEIAKLQQKKYRQKYQLALIYNDKVINEAIINDCLVCLITNDEQKIQKDQVLVVTDQVLEKLHPHHHCHELAIVKLNFVNEIKAQKVLVLDHVQDPGNLGSIIRSACCFGIKDIVISPASCDLLSDKVIINSAGAIFNCNIYVSNIYKYLQDSPLPIITSFLDEPSDQINHLNGFNLVIGNEQLGIDKKIKELDHLNFLIPIDFESLNVSVATGIMLYELNKGK